MNTRILAATVAALAAVTVPTMAQAIANPASTFCAKMRGRSVIARLPDGGTLSLCYLPHDRIVEEWTLFRMLNGKVPPQNRNPFR